MKEQINELANILAISILADGAFENQENDLLDALENDTELPGLASSIKDVISMAHVFSDDEMTDILYSSAAKFSTEDKPKVFEAAISTVLADGVITESEIGNILTLAEALEVPVEKAIARLLFQVQEKEGELLVDVEADLEDYIIVGGRTRFTSWESFEKMLTEKSYTSDLIEALRTVNDWAEETFGYNAQINYTPNFMTLACRNPISRSKTFCFVRMKNDFIRFEYAGNVDDIKFSTEFLPSIKKGITEYFNLLSSFKI
jgi:hypothetical protein